MDQNLYSGDTGVVDLGTPQQQLLLLQVSTGATPGTVTIGDNPAITVPPNSDWEWIPKQRWYGITITLEGTVFYFVEAL